MISLHTIPVTIVTLWASAISWIEAIAVPIKIGFTEMYELDEVVSVTSLIFPNGADENTIVDFVY